MAATVADDLVTVTTNNPNILAVIMKLSWLVRHNNKQFNTTKAIITTVLDVIWANWSIKIPNIINKKHNENENKPAERKHVEKQWVVEFRSIDILIWVRPIQFEPNRTELNVNVWNIGQTAMNAK